MNEAGSLAVVREKHKSQLCGMRAGKKFERETNQIAGRPSPTTCFNDTSLRYWWVGWGWPQRHTSAPIRSVSHLFLNPSYNIIRNSDDAFDLFLGLERIEGGWEIEVMIGNVCSLGISNYEENRPLNWVGLKNLTEVWFRRNALKPNKSTRKRVCSSKLSNHGIGHAISCQVFFWANHKICISLEEYSRNTNWVFVPFINVK